MCNRNDEKDPLLAWKVRRCCAEDVQEVIEVVQRSGIVRGSKGVAVMSASLTSRSSKCTPIARNADTPRHSPTLPIPIILVLPSLVHRHWIRSRFLCPFPVTGPVFQHARPLLDPLDPHPLAKATASGPFTERMILDILIKGHDIRAVLAAEDIPAFATVVPPLEETEGLGAGGVVADRGVRIGLPACTGGRAGDGGQVIR